MFLSAALSVCASCYRPDPTEGLPCSAANRGCPDGQECGSDNICRAAGTVVPEVDGAACPVSTCEIEVLASQSVTAAATSALEVSAAHPDYIFWSSSDDGILFRTDKATLSTILLDQGNVPYGLAADDAQIYWSDSRTSGAILARPATASSAPQAIAAGQDFPLHVAVDAENVYWGNAGGLVLSATKAGGGLSMVATSPGDGPAGALALDDARVYFADRGGGRVIAVDKQGGELSILAEDQDAPLGVAVDAQHVYWASSGGGEVRRVPVAGGEAELVAGEQGGASFVALGPRHVYWTSRDDGRVMRADKSTLASGPVAEGQNQPFGLSLDGEALYWVNQSGPDRVMRTFPCACP